MTAEEEKKGGSLTRRAAMALAGAGALGAGAWAAFGRKRLARELDEDEEKGGGPMALRRPFGPDPKREISVLGYGGIRLPTRNRSDRDMDLELGRKLVSYALRHGVNTFDTGYVYHKGEGEKFWGALLPKETRSGYFLSDKMCTWKIGNLGDAKAMFEEQLKRCETPYFDMYFLHSLSGEEQYREKYVKSGVLDYLKRERDRGRIKYIGFSYHGKVPFLEKLLKEEKWQFAMIVHNALVANGKEGSLEQCRLLKEANVAGLVMEPLGGGRLARMHGEALRMLKEAKPGWSAASWGLRYAATHPAIQTVYSGMGAFAHLKENVATLSTEYAPLGEAELGTYAKAVAEFDRHKTVPCTGCAYCVPCPYGVKIPEIFAWWNRFAGSGRLPAKEGANDSQKLRREFLAAYSHAVAAGGGPEKCIKCRKCVTPCPQWLFRIPTEMEKIDKFLAGVREDYVAKGGRL